MMNLDFKLLKENCNEEKAQKKFGELVKAVLNSVMISEPMPVKIKGNKNDIKAFLDVIKKEKIYMETYMGSELDDPELYRAWHELDVAIDNFEERVGIKWPLK